MEESVKNLLISIINSNFTSTTGRCRNRKIIFWYDPEHSYSDSINELKIENTEIIKYDNNSLWIRYHIEKEELNKNIVIYLPFEKNKNVSNELLDLETANADLLFNPDKVTMILIDLGLSDACRQVVKNNESFFKDKTRREAFIKFDIKEKNPENIDYIITAILLGIKSVNVDDILKNIIKCYYDDLKKYEKLLKFGNVEFIIDLLNKYFGTEIKEKENFESLFNSLIFTYFASSLKDINKIKKYQKYILTNKMTNIQVFVNNLMRDKSTKKYFELISNNLIEELEIKKLLSTLELDEYKYSDAFKTIDENIISYITNELENDGKEYNSYEKLIFSRESKYWYEKFCNEYNFLNMANNYLKEVDKISSLIKTYEIEKFVDLYSKKIFLIDTLYRKIYFFFDKINDKDVFMKLREKIENHYINKYMYDLSQKWCDIIENLNRYDSNKLILQNNFFDKYIKNHIEGVRSSRIFVIISDAFRYECAKELNDKLKIFGTKSDINYMLGLVPSYTGLGMASLLPNKKLERDLKYKENKSDNILVDGVNSARKENREKILKKAVPESMVIQYDKLYEMMKSEWKKEFAGKKLIYIYHDVIDKSGEHDENNVFESCQKAIDELEKLIRDLHTTFGGVNCYITADHGFFYRREKIEEHQKTSKDLNAIKEKRRYEYSDQKSSEEGVISISLDYIFGENSGYVNIPKGYNIFSKKGSDSKYIHGGVLPQEVIIPVIDFKSTRTSEETKKVGISYTGLTTRITNAITYLEFQQDNNIDENNLPCRYLLYFEDENENKISNECIIIANYSNMEVKDRCFREKFVFKNMEYNRDKSYFLVITDEETGIEKLRIRFIIDIPIALQ